MSPADTEQPDATIAAAAGNRSQTGRKRGPIFPRGRMWWIQYTYRGEVYRESSHSTRRKDAEALYRRRQAEIGRGRLIGPDGEKVSSADLVQILRDDYKANRLRSLPRLEGALLHLAAFFEGSRAVEITSDRVLRYIATRQEEGAAAAQSIENSPLSDACSSSGSLPKKWQGGRTFRS